MHFWSSSITWEQAGHLCTINVNIKTRHLLRPSRSALKQTQQRDKHIQFDWLTYTDVSLTHRHKSELWVPKEGCESPWQHEARAQEYILAVRCKENFNEEWYVCESQWQKNIYFLGPVFNLRYWTLLETTLWRILLNKLGPNTELDVFRPYSDDAAVAGCDTRQNMSLYTHDLQWRTEPLHWWSPVILAQLCLTSTYYAWLLAWFTSFM